MSRTYKAVVREDRDVALPDLARAAERARMWVPKEGQRLLIELPSERLMAVVAKVVNPDVVICELTDIPLLYGKTHHYAKGEFVPCERNEATHETIWRAFQPRTTPKPAPEPDEPQKPRQRKKRNGASKTR